MAAEVTCFHCLSLLAKVYLEIIVYQVHVPNNTTVKYQVTLDLMMRINDDILQDAMKNIVYRMQLYIY